MNIVMTAFKYLKKRPLLACSAFFSIMLASVFEGASFGMIIPLVQAMMNSGNNILEKLPMARQMSPILHSFDQRASVSFIFIALFFIIAAKNIFTYISNILIAKLRFATARDLSVALMDGLIEYDPKFFDTMKTGSLIAVVNNEAGRMGDFMLAALNFTAILTRVVTFFIILFFISWKASAAIFLLIAIVLIPLEFIVKRSKRIGERVSAAFAAYNVKVTEILSGIRLIKACGTEDHEKQGFRSAAGDVYKFQYMANKNTHLLIPLSEVAIFALIMVSFLIMTHVTRIDMAAAFPFVAVYLLVLTKALTQLNLLNSTRSTAVTYFAAFDRYERIYDEKGKKTIISGSLPVDRFTDAIEFKGVGFSYSGHKRVLKGIDIRIPRGKITAVVGASGVGKTTLINLILRFYDVNEGRITIDGADIRDLDLKAWRKKIGLVSQDAFIFNVSARDNIAYAHPGAGEERIMEAAKASGAHEFIMSLPSGYDTVLGERGVSLSGGQRQRISIARAVLHDPEILILDEAMSSIDTETERAIQYALDRLTRNRTVIAIAHRLSTVARADKIIVLDRGAVVDDGRHDDLIKKEGLYKRLYEAQFQV
ncbi:MAG: ABC transporter ATP-binding protein [Candidatus Omnitrophota bacterium]